MAPKWSSPNKLAPNQLESKIIYLNNRVQTDAPKRILPVVETPLKWGGGKNRTTINFYVLSEAKKIKKQRKNTPVHARNGKYPLD